MNPRLSLAFLALLWTGCASSRQAEKAPAPMAAQASPADEADATPAKMSADKTPESEEPAGRSQFESEGASESSEKKTSESEPSPAEQLTSSEASLQSALAPETLSCSGAKPLKDTICSLAKRICESTEPSSLNAQKQCEEARKGCTNAEQKYASKCD